MTSHCLWRFKATSRHSSNVFVCIRPDQRPTDRSSPISFVDRPMDRLIRPVQLHLKNHRSLLHWAGPRTGTGPRLSIPDDNQTRSSGSHGRRDIVPFTRTYQPNLSSSTAITITTTRITTARRATTLQTESRNSAPMEPNCKTLSRPSMINFLPSTTIFNASIPDSTTSLSLFTNVRNSVQNLPEDQTHRPPNTVLLPSPEFIGFSFVDRDRLNSSDQYCSWQVGLIKLLSEEDRFKGRNHGPP